ncbi:hypothetical protein JJB75_13875 [Clostridium perfringens]|uniref:hypothetical protein n=1 Tax=Clostridium perfringens TaxID=1502 RepID=UPI000BBF65B6|nr:hypothetical protein [Clostridium perfringens]ASY52795.1 hypothetical protein BG908_14500 [Clostridium perfringens]AWS24381.1 hypothetical protein CYK96_01640 [Clostridium perfringens]MBO3304275.1 hypothetical protein [Clostridium perfringens]MBO3307595.1 hypothetical protein [Clostridium perfringens]MBO3309865.1 hypothetical protein [Clostridium perfringens]
MNRKEIIGQLEDLLYNFKNFESVETTDDDVVALEFAIDELSKNSSEYKLSKEVFTLNDSKLGVLKVKKISTY